MGTEPAPLVRHLHLFGRDRHRRVHGRTFLRLRGRPRSLARTLPSARRLCRRGSGNRAVRAGLSHAARGGRCRISPFGWVAGDPHGSRGRAVVVPTDADGSHACRSCRAGSAPRGEPDERLPSCSPPIHSAESPARSARHGFSSGSTVRRRRARWRPGSISPSRCSRCWHRWRARPRPGAKPPSPRHRRHPDLSARPTSVRGGGFSDRLPGDGITGGLESHPRLRRREQYHFVLA